MTSHRPGLAERLAGAREGGRKLLVPFITAGFPGRAATAEALAGLAAAGADAIELGAPFSDPLADGPAIAGASEVALAGGMTLRAAIDLAAERDPAGPPLVLFTYLNPVSAMGAEAAAEACREAGFAAALVADLPFDEDPSVGRAFAERGLPLVRLAAPTTPESRLRALAAGAEGFVYLIARTGVTGKGSGTDPRAAEQVRILRQETALPIVVGFGIRDLEDARRAADIADGVVVGSVLVERMGKDGTAAALDWLAALRQGLDAG